MTSCFYTIRSQWPESCTTLCLEKVHQMTVPVGRSTTTVFGRVHQNAALRAKFAIYDWLDKALLLRASRRHHRTDRQLMLNTLYRILHLSYITVSCDVLMFYRAKLYEMMLLDIYDSPYLYHVSFPGNCHLLGVSESMWLAAVLNCPWSRLQRLKFPILR